MEYLNIEQKHGVWQSAPPIPSALVVPKIAHLDSNVYLMGSNNQVLYLFDVQKNVWSQKTAMPQNPLRAFSIAAGNGNLYAAGDETKTCWQYNCTIDSWAKRANAAMIFHQNSLLLLGGLREDIEGYATEADIWAVAPYKLPEKLLLHYAFMMDLGE